MARPAAVPVYTAIAGDYPIRRRDDVRCFVDAGVFARPVMEAKRYKILSHLFYPQDEITVWVDANISLRAESRQVVNTLLGDADLAVFRHPYRETVWQEFATLKDDPRFAIPYLQTQLTEQWRTYRMEGLPASTGLFECNVLIRRNNPRVTRLMETWWAQICRWQWRDQVSFPYALWKHADVNVAAIEGNAREHPFFDYVSQY